MKIYRNYMIRCFKLSISVFITTYFVLCSSVISSQMEVPQFIDRTIEPISKLIKDQPVRFRLEYKINSQFINLAGYTGSVTLYLTPYRDENEILAKYEWPIQYGTDYSYVIEFDLVIPDNNVFTLHYQIICGKAIQDGTYFFNSVANEIVFSDAISDPPLPRDQNSIISNIVPVDFLTIEQKNKVFTFAVDLSDSAIKKYAESLIGSISDDNLITNYKKNYLIETSLENAIKIAKQGTAIDFINRPRWLFDMDKQEYNLIIDSI